MHRCFQPHIYKDIDVKGLTGLARHCVACLFLILLLYFYLMNRKYKFKNPERAYFVSFAVVEWRDVFTRNIYKDILIDSLTYCQKNKGLEIFSWCMMTNHIHLLIRSGGSENLSTRFSDN